MVDKVRSTIYNIDAVANRSRAWGGSPVRWAARAYRVGRDGRTVPLLFTEAMLVEAENIAMRNPEDIGEHSPDTFRTVEVYPQRVHVLSLILAAVLGVGFGLAW